jgi:hypothetical protein
MEKMNQKSLESFYVIFFGSDKIHLDMLSPEEDDF